MTLELHALAHEVLARIGAAPHAGAAPQLIAAADGRCLLREGASLREIPAGELPGKVDLAHLIDHTLLKANAQASEIDRLCDEAAQHHFASVCVNGYWVKRCAQRLAGTAVNVCTVVGFPLGAMTTFSKAAEARDAVANGAREVDMVLAVGLAKAGDWEGVRADCRALREATRGVCLKVILETCLLTDEEKAQACRIAVEEGLDFVKTSTGFSTGGATEADVRLMRQTVGTAAGVKASGAVRTYQDALGMVLAGATRLGLSSSIAVVQGGAGQGAY